MLWIPWEEKSWDLLCFSLPYSAAHSFQINSLKSSTRILGTITKPAWSCKGGFGKGANRHLGPPSASLANGAAFPWGSIPQTRKLRQLEKGEGQHPAHCSFYPSCSKAAPSFPISLFLTFSGGRECLFRGAVQAATQLARAEPSSEGNKSPSKNEVLRSLEKSLSIAPAPCHTYPFCAVYKLQLFGFWTVKDHGERRTFPLFCSALTQGCSNRDFGYPQASSLKEQEGDGFPVLIFRMVWSRTHIYHSTSLLWAWW